MMFFGGSVPGKVSCLAFVWGPVVCLAYVRLANGARELNAARTVVLKILHPTRKT